MQDTYDQNNRDQINLRLDHNFNSAHKASFVYTYGTRSITRQRPASSNGRAATTAPTGSFPGYTTFRSYPRSRKIW